MVVNARCSNSVPTLQRIGSFEEIGQTRWNELVEHSERPSVFQTFGWLTSWWETFKISSWDLLLISATKDDQLVGLAPLYLRSIAPSGGRVGRYIGFVGEEHGDYLALILDRNVEGLVELFVKEILRYARMMRAIFLEIPAETKFARYLRAWSTRITSRIEFIGETICPRLCLENEARLKATLNKDSLKRHMVKLGKLGQVTVEHHMDSASISPLLSNFFQQHVARWSSTRYPSLFLKPLNCVFYERFVAALTNEKQIIFTVLRLNDQPIAFHLGLVSYGDFLWYKPSFDIAFSQVSPGEVMLRELLMMAVSRQFSVLDFTRGDEAFKRRFASEYRTNISFIIHRNAIEGAMAKIWRTAKVIIKNRLFKSGSN